MIRCGWVLVSIAVVAGCQTNQAQEADDDQAARTEAEQLSVAASGFERRELDQLPNIATRMPGVDWPSFLGPNRDSKSPETGILKQWPATGLPIVWQRVLQESYGIGSVSNGRFYQCDRVGDRTKLHCLKAETGEAIWEFDYPTDYVDHYGYNGGPRCSPVIDGNRVYIFGVEGMLHCLRADDGRLVWKVDTAKEFGVIQNFFGVGSTPVIEDDLLIVMVGGSPKDAQDVAPGRLDLVAADGAGIVAFDKYTGHVRYKLADELASYSSPQLATIDGRRWCFVLARGGLVAFDPKTGKIDFQYPWRARVLESVNASTPVVVGDEVFISETYGPGSSLLKVRPGGEVVIWRDDPKMRAKAMQAHWNTPIYHEGYLYGCSGRNPPDADLRCVEWKTGKVMWTVPNRMRTSLLLVDGHFVCLEERGKLQLFKPNPERFELVAEMTLRDPMAGPQPFGFEPPPLLRYPCWAAPILSHGLLYVRGDDRLICLELIRP